MMCDLNNEQLKALCVDAVNKITDIAEQSCAKMEELRVELKAEEEKLKCENSFKVDSKFQESDKNDPSCGENLKVKVSAEECSTSEVTCRTEMSEHESKQGGKSDKIYKERYERFQHFKKIEKILCYDLGISTKYEKFEILSPKRMEHCKKELQKLYLLKKKRQQHYHQIISEIRGLLSEMEIFSWSEFEKSALNEGEFPVTKENLNALHEWKIRLINQFEEEHKIIENLKQKIIELWDKLAVSAESRRELLHKISEKHARKYIVTELQMELHKLEKLWKQKIRQDVLDMRKEIIGLWVECHVGKSQRDRFIAFNSEVFDEELMTVHRDEIKRLKQLQREIMELGELAIKWSEMKDKFTEMEMSNKNVNRFNNRGGNLLREEKERKKHQKNISTLESKIKHFAVKYNAEQGTHFHFNGRPILQMIEEARISSKSGKENLTMQDRVSKRKQSIGIMKNREHSMSLKNHQLKNLSKPRLSYNSCFGKSALRI